MIITSADNSEVERLFLKFFDEGDIVTARVILREFSTVLLVKTKIALNQMIKPNLLIKHLIRNKLPTSKEKLGSLLELVEEELKSRKETDE